MEKVSAEKMLSFQLFMQQERDVHHTSFENEVAFYAAVRNGDFVKVKELLQPLNDAEGLGKLSSNPIRNCRYHFIIAIAMITRFCIEGGLSPEIAYTLSDIYIQQADELNDVDLILALHHEAVYDYTERMKKIKNKVGYSKSVIKTSDYINEHLTERIVLDDLSAYLGVNKSYLCELFKKETGFTILSYITKLKIEAAQKMLIYTDFDAVDIANYFAFSSHSHFISTFKKLVGMTPNEFKKKNYRHYFQNLIDKAAAEHQDENKI